MSAETKAALEAALQTHVADEFATATDSTNAIVSGYVTKVHVVDLTSEDKYSRYFFIKPDQQAYHETYGLLVTAQDDFVSQAIEDEE